VYVWLAGEGWIGITQSSTARRIVPVAAGSTARIAINRRAGLTARVGVLAMEDVPADDYARASHTVVIGYHLDVAVHAVNPPEAWRTPLCGFRSSPRPTRASSRSPPRHRPHRTVARTPNDLGEESTA
jgi:hypothetical protein